MTVLAVSQFTRSIVIKLRFNVTVAPGAWQIAKLCSVSVDNVRADFAHL